MLKNLYLRMAQIGAVVNQLANSHKLILTSLLSALLILVPIRLTDAAQESSRLSIGQIQGSGQVSPYLSETVKFRGIVTGIREDQNLQGVRYYTLFVQDLPENRDSAKSTSDGIAVFLGRRRPPAIPGDVVTVIGSVTEYYGLTEIDDKGLTLTIDSHGAELPKALEIEPPTSVKEAANYFERHEGMLVKMPTAIVVGPTHQGCGFAAVDNNTGIDRFIKHNRDTNVGQIINILNWTDVNCDHFPDVLVGDIVRGLEGPMTYHFDQFKLVQQNLDQLVVAERRDYSQNVPSRDLTDTNFEIVTFNLHNFFDNKSETGDAAEPVYSDAELELKKKKLSFVIANVLNCPEVLGVQEVENAMLLADLAKRMSSDCNFTYSVNHRESADIRGADVALLTDPRSIQTVNITQHQSCTSLETGVVDSHVKCPSGEEPLFSRQPLQVDLTIEQVPVSIIVVHFKSKRGGEVETQPRRIAQATFINQFVEQLSNEHPSQNIIVLGDFNDYYHSSAMNRLRANGFLADHFAELPEDQQYSYIFDGASQLIDGILVSPSLSNKVVRTNIYHVNADFPNNFAFALDERRMGYRSSDHDIPALVLTLSRQQSIDMESTAHIAPPTEEIPSNGTDIEAMDSISSTVDKSPTQAIISVPTAPNVVQVQSTAGSLPATINSADLGQDDLEAHVQTPSIFLFILGVILALVLGIWIRRLSRS